MGTKKDINNESIFFQDINKLLFRLAGASWDNPYNLKFIDEFFLTNAIKIINTRLTSFSKIKYFGLKRFHSFHSIGMPWGWKDPRTTFLIRIWGEIFPERKIIHVYRNPFDIANSLRKRQKQLQEKYQYGLKEKIKAKYFLNRISLGSTYRCLDIDEGIHLWKNYVETSLQIKHNIIHIKYEDLLTDPENEFDKIIEFLNLKISAEDLKNVAGKINFGRKFAFRNDPYLLNKFENYRNDPLIEKLGYNNPGQ